jgi:hypothetical protein
MVRNFRPGATPCDYDHLGLEPKQVGNGVAAGWLQELQVRDDGQSLFARVDWTPAAAAHIKNREYAFISPSFTKDHVTNTGEAVGCTLLAIALTNFPFLTGMQSVLLYSDHVMGELALPDTTPPVDVAIQARAIAKRVLNLAQVGQRVTFDPDPELTPELSDTERAQVCEVKATVGDDGSDDQFTQLQTLAGEALGWYRITQLRAAPTTEPPQKETLMPSQTPTQTLSNDAATTLEARAYALIAERGWNPAKDFAKALKAVSRDEALALSYRAHANSTTVADAEPSVPAPVISLSRREGERFSDLVSRHAAEHQLPLKTALQQVSQVYPELATQYAQGSELQSRR